MLKEIGLKNFLSNPNNWNFNIMYFVKNGKNLINHANNQVDNTNNPHNNSE